MVFFSFFAVSKCLLTSHLGHSEHLWVVLSDSSFIRVRERDSDRSAGIRVPVLSEPSRQQRRRTSLISVVFDPQQKWVVNTLSKRPRLLQWLHVCWARPWAYWEHGRVFSTSLVFLQLVTPREEGKETRDCRRSNEIPRDHWWFTRALLICLPFMKNAFLLNTNE